MTEKRPQDSRVPERSEGQASPPRGNAVSRLDRLISYAKAALLWERLWRALLIPILVAGLFLCLSFAGLWLEIGATWRIFGVLLLGAAFVLGLVPLLRFVWRGMPSRKEALARIDRVSGLAHHPALGLDDTLANPGDDATTRALWQLHRRRIEASAAGLRVGRPSPRMVDVDRYALRAAILIALVACCFLAGPEKYARVAAAFDWQGGIAESGGFRTDAWIDPPAYTGKAPVLLTLAGTKANQIPVRVEAPIGSTVIVRASDDSLRLETHGALETVKEDDKARAAADDKTRAAAPAKSATTRLPAGAGAAVHGADGAEQRLALRGDAQLGLWHGNSQLGLFDLVVIPDKPPQIQLTDAPRPNVRGSLTLSYKISDDYGVTGATADFTKPYVDGAKGSMRSLVDPPHLILNLPASPGGLGETETTGDLSEHPWAGAHVTMVLTARDEGGNEGKSDPIEIVLPQKTFTKPIAKALVEQRRNLVLFPDDRGHVLTALEALMIAPESFGTSAGVYLGLDVAVHMLRGARTDAEVLGVADYLWAMALDIENGGLSDAERELRAAEQKLRDALQRHAPDDEIAKLTQELRSAMDKFLKEFAEKQMREQGRESADQSQDRSRTISPKDLQSMLDRMQDMARAGDHADAQKMLEQLQNLLENLQTARRRNQDPQRQQMSRALKDLDKMMREQQALRDETHDQQESEEMGGNMPPGLRRPSNPQQQRQGKGNMQQGQSGDQGLQDKQRALRDRLEQLQKRMQQGGQGKPGLDDAGKAMRDAENALGQGKRGREGAVDAQGRALEAMRREAQNLAEQMQQGQGQPGQDVGEEEGQSGVSSKAQGGEDTDPLGRPLSNDPLNPRARFDPMGVPAAQRAQRVLEELRKRLADPSRPREEMDYLERLLKRY